jgi:hypothetical protein
MQQSSSGKASEESNKRNNLFDGTTTDTTADVSTTLAFGATTITTTEKGGIGVATIMMISRVNDLVTTITKSTQLSGSLVDVIMRKTTTKP